MPKRKKLGPWSEDRKKRWIKARWGKSKSVFPEVNPPGQDAQKEAQDNLISTPVGGTTGQ